MEILHKFGKKVATKCQKVLGANSFACSSPRGKAGWGGEGGGDGGVFLSPSWIGLKSNYCCKNLYRDCINVNGLYWKKSSLRKGSITKNILDIFLSETIILEKNEA